MENSKYATHVVDVFAEKKYGGNQLAVARDGASIEDAQMQKIACEFNFSETTFILSHSEIGGGYDVRIFTPKEELPLPGHPTLGTAYVIQKEIVGKQVDSPFATSFEPGDGLDHIGFKVRDPAGMFKSLIRKGATSALVSADRNGVKGIYHLKDPNGNWIGFF